MQEPRSICLSSIPTTIPQMVGDLITSVDTLLVPDMNEMLAAEKKETDYLVVPGMADACKAPHSNS